MSRVVKETIIQEQSPNMVASVSRVASNDTPTQVVANTVYFIFGLIDILLLFRLLLKVTGANAGSPFVASIYGFTQVLIYPFQGIFRTAVTPGLEMRSVFEPATLIAMIFYAFLAWVIVKLISILTGHSDEEL